MTTNTDFLHPHARVRGDRVVRRITRSITASGGAAAALVAGAIAIKSGAAKTASAESQIKYAAAEVSAARPAALFSERTAAARVAAARANRRPPGPRSLDGQAGLPTRLEITIINRLTCKPLQHAAVDIWYCDASGVYSNISSENTVGETYLRGVQFTDKRGRVTFQTIFPGHYAGRTAHVHARVHISSHDSKARASAATLPTPGRSSLRRSQRRGVPARPP